MPATGTAATAECFVAVPLCALTGPHDPHRLSASDFAAALARAAADMPDWPVVVILPYGPVPECLFEQPLDAFRGHVARCAFIGQPRKASRFARNGVQWFARPKGSTVAEAIHCRTYTEALHAAAGIGCHAVPTSAQLTFEDSRLILSDSRGIYIPRDFCDGIDADGAARIGVSFADVLICQAGPDHEWYWDSWQSILDSANLTDANGNRWILYQSGDLWEIPADCEIPDCF